MLNLGALILLGIFTGVGTKFIIDKFIPDTFNRLMDSLFGVIFLMILVAVVNQESMTDLLIFTNVATGSYLAVEVIGDQFLKQ